MVALGHDANRRDMQYVIPHTALAVCGVCIMRSKGGDGIVCREKADVINARIMGLCTS